eukprot:Gregarina_sp_Pseudo_9__3256@NODE_343_length_3100_cov_5_267886_g323_i0_p1_GENE_NODE_343_length_3100_cov_5_267886_g323_i0NODE_343_length_3100_cov_5_267886_g323_i0_p1_ORF_typecomplete_len995_score230_03MCM/PF00493_23/6_5e93MCM_OB/PF17207_3/2_3e33MCM_lid/PF17855_1/2_7e24MCM6_C/PF18263_1/1e12Mg_chelatase/PF01078_21/6_1e12AAA_5/PF07728_14/4_4e06Sigma54_activat/PF00158_26/9_5e02Sigma54_activat/PF00158_26/5_9e05AAA_3/PF07726_11/1_8e05Sigma54_activ_2/PF14532_6/0_0003VirE/PF05272_11/0_0015RuvB_N/PF05496_1
MPDVSTLSPNWIDELLRRENKTVEETWFATFEKEFHEWLRLPIPTAQAADLTSASHNFRSYIQTDFVLTDLKCIYLHLDAFRSFVEERRIQKSNLRFQRTSATSQCPPLPAATPFNSCSEFVEFFFLRLRDVLKIAVVDFIQEFVGAIGESLTADIKAKLSALSPKEGDEHSFELVPVMPSQMRSLRDLRPEDCGRILLVPGVVTRCSDVKPELRFASFECQACSQLMENVVQQFKFTEPAYCWTQNCGNRTKWNIKMESSIFGDWQKLRVQQSTTDEVPAGSVPRTIDVIARGVAVEKCKPGDRIFLTGCLLSVPDVPALLGAREIPKEVSQEGNRKLQSETGAMDASIRGLKKLGVRDLTHRQMFFAMNVQVQTGSDIPTAVQLSTSVSSSVAVYSTTSPGGRLLRQLMMEDTPSDDSNVRFNELLDHPLLRSLKLTRAIHSKFKIISKSNRCLDRLCAAMAPEIWGNQEIKKGLLLMLVGGVEKTTRKDRIRLRGDINMLLVGDPGTAKSQFLKFIQEFAERAVLTSGKSSTAAGLTASVHKDAEQGDAVVEAGALILADQGICCIDEFEKMADKDMVAIHEAMEQQSISISKAGVQATMNARASVLAACNPAEGKYDPSRSLRQNLRLSPTILSRFDLIFVLLDRACEEDDIRIAKHVLGLSMFNPGSTGEHRLLTGGDETLRGTLLESQAELKTYVKIAKVFRPILTPEARSILIRSYVGVRQRDSLLSSKSARMTVRQLESMIRLSEAIAKLHFSQIVTDQHAEAAVRIFNNALSKSKREVIDLTDIENEDGDDEEEETETEMADTGARGSSRKLNIDSGLFVVMQNQIILHLRDLQEELLVAPNVSGAKTIRDQMKRGALTEWYVREHVKEATSAEDREAETRLVKAVMRRMINNDVLISESESLELEDLRNAILKVHPNVEQSRESAANRRKKQRLSTQFYAATSDTQPPETTTSSTGGGSAVAVARSGGGLELQDHEFLSLVYPS